MAVTYLMLLFLGRSFRSLASGEWFDLRISRYLRSAAALMLIEALFSPVYRTVTNLLLTMHQPPGERLLLIGAGLERFRMIASGLVLWILADLLVKGMEAENENRQFI